MYTNATFGQLKQAAEVVNDLKGYEIIVNEFKAVNSRRNRFRIRSSRSGIKGACFSASGKKSVSASWHAHGYFFDALFAINPDAYVISKGNKITKDGGNWKDYNVGNYFIHIYASELSIL